MSLPLTHPDLRALLAATLAATPSAGAVICLCAAWCGTCRAFEPGFRQAALAHPGLAFRWLDVEDEADALGDLDIETFPSLVIGAAAAGTDRPPAAQPGLVNQARGVFLTLVN